MHAALHGLFEDADYADSSPFAGDIEGGLPLIIADIRISTVSEENFSTCGETISGAFHERSHSAVFFSDIDTYTISQDEVQAFGGCGSCFVQRGVTRRWFCIGRSSTFQKKTRTLGVIVAQSIMQRRGTGRTAGVNISPGIQKNLYAVQVAVYRGHVQSRCRAFFPWFNGKTMIEHQTDTIRVSAAGCVHKVAEAAFIYSMRVCSLVDEELSQYGIADSEGLFQRRGKVRMDFLSGRSAFCQQLNTFGIILFDGYVEYGIE